VLPLLADSEDDPLGRQLGERLWPEWFTDRHVELARAQGERSWMSLYQQKPAASEGVILLKRYWRCWPHGRQDPDPQQLAAPWETEPPKNWTQTFLCYDTAIEDGEDNDYSAMSAWAAFGRKPAEDKRLSKSIQTELQHLVMLGGWRAKVPAVDLLRHVEEHIKFYMPDHIVIEKKASGHQLLQALHRSRPRYNDIGQVHYVAIHAWEPPFPAGAKGKVPRGHSAALELAQGSVWFMPGATNLAIIKECAAAPNGRYLDWFDTVTMAVIWARSINLLEVQSDLRHEDEDRQSERDDHERWDPKRRGYGRTPYREGTQASDATRRLYGRAPKNKGWNDTASG
jgi:phage terminase large subunit-like protein